MQTSQLDNGLLNNYAIEPDTYYAVFPSPEQARKYIYQGTIATFLVISLVLLSCMVS